MIIRSALPEDIPALITGILEIERLPDGNKTTYDQLFGCTEETTRKILTDIFQDEENKHTELSLSSFTIAEIDGQAAGFCALIHTDAEYYISKSELFPIHLPPIILEYFSRMAAILPDQRPLSSNKYFIEYIYTSPDYRQKGIAATLVEHQSKNVLTDDVYINVFSNKDHLIEFYKKLGFYPDAEVVIDTADNAVYPSRSKFILKRKESTI